MAEFDLIRALVDELGSVTTGPDTLIGPGDDCAVTRPPAAMDLVSSIDSLVAGVHFPATSRADLIGFRAMCVSFSDVAAMGARPAFATIALTLPDPEEPWLRDFARGIATAARRFGCTVVGGNLASGPLEVSISAHGWVPAGCALLRSGAQIGDLVYLAGRLGVGAAALSREDLDHPPVLEELLALDPGDERYPLRRYFAPEPDFRLANQLLGVATASIDLSDGFLADLAHVCEASEVGVVLTLDTIECYRDMEGADGDLNAGDDYLLCVTAPPGGLGDAVDLAGLNVVGTVTGETGIRTQDGATLVPRGYDHFRGEETALAPDRERGPAG